VKTNLYRAQSSLNLAAQLDPLRRSGTPGRIERALKNDEVEAATRLEGWDKYVIHPRARWKQVFDAVVAVTILYSLITAPINVAYSPTRDIMPALSILAEGLWIVDIVLQFFHGFYDLGSRRLPVMKLRKVAMTYARPINVIPDVLSALSMPLIAISRETFLEWQLLASVRLVRLHRLKQRRTGIGSANKAVKILEPVCLWLLVAHWLGCFFFMLGWRSCGATWTGTRGGVTWVTHFWPQLAEACVAGAPPSSIPAISGDLGFGPPLWAVYVRATYWGLATMSSLGYASGITAYTEFECVLAIAAQVCGACFAAVIFSNVAQVINRGDAAATRYSAQLDRINEFIRFHQLPPVIRDKLHGYHDLLFSINRGFDLQQIASIFPRNVQEDTFFFMYEQIVRKVPMFNVCDDNFIRTLVRLLKPQVLLEGDYAFRYGEMGDTMYFVQSGIVQIGNEGFSTVYASLAPGKYFGELALFTSQPRTASARAIRDCTLYSLTTADFNAVIEKHPLYYDVIIDKAMERLSQTKNENKSIEARISVVSELTAMLRSKKQRSTNEVIAAAPEGAPTAAPPPMRRQVTRLNVTNAVRRTSLRNSLQGLAGGASAVVSTVRRGSLVVLGSSARTAPAPGHASGGLPRGSSGLPVRPGAPLPPPPPVSGPPANDEYMSTHVRRPSRARTSAMSSRSSDTEGADGERRGIHGGWDELRNCVSGLSSNKASPEPQMKKVVQMAVEQHHRQSAQSAAAPADDQPPPTLERGETVEERLNRESSTTRESAHDSSAAKGEASATAAAEPLGHTRTRVEPLDMEGASTAAQPSAASAEGAGTGTAADGTTGDAAGAAAPASAQTSAWLSAGNKAAHAAQTAHNESLITLAKPGRQAGEPSVQEGTAMRQLQTGIANLDASVKQMAKSLQAIAERLPDIKD